MGRPKPLLQTTTDIDLQRPNISASNRRAFSFDSVKSIRSHPSTIIPKYHLLAEKIEKYKTRGQWHMEPTIDEEHEIKRMMKWRWKTAGNPTTVPIPVGPKGEEWDFHIAQNGRQEDAELDERPRFLGLPPALQKSSRPAQPSSQPPSSSPPSTATSTPEQEFQALKLTRTKTLRDEGATNAYAHPYPHTVEDHRTRGSGP